MIDSYYVLVEEHFGVGFMDVLNHADKTLKPVGVKWVHIFHFFVLCNNGTREWMIKQVILIPPIKIYIWSPILTQYSK